MKTYLAVITCFAIAVLFFVGGCQEQAQTTDQPTMTEEVTPPEMPAVEEATKVEETVETVKPVVEQPKVEPVAEAPKVDDEKLMEDAKKQAKKKPEAAPVAKKTTPKVETPDEDKFKGIEVIVNDTEITTEQAKEPIKANLEQIDAQLPENVRDTYKNRELQKSVQNLIDEMLVQEQIEKAGIVITDQDVEDYINKNLADANMTMDQLVEKIKADGMTLEQWKERMQFKKGLAFEKLTEEQFAPKLVLGPNEVSDFYNQNPRYFVAPEMVRASHILIKTGEGIDPNQAKAKAEDILKQVKAGGDFAELATKYSDCPSASKGGDLDFFPKGRMAKPFEDAAFGMEVGQISDIVETQFGYHIITVTDKKAAETVTLEKASKSIEDYLKMEKRKKLNDEYKKSLRSAANIVYPPGKDPKDQKRMAPARPGAAMRPAPRPAPKPAAPKEQPAK